METTSTTTSTTHTLDEQVDLLEQNLNGSSSLAPIETQSLPSNEDATERESTPRLNRHSHHDADEAGQEDDADQADQTDDETDEEDLDDSEYDSSDYETGSETGSETSFINVTMNPMYQILATFLESPDLENRINVTEAIIELKGSVDRVADALEKMASRPKREKKQLLR